MCFLCICEASYPRKLAFTYLSDLATEFTTTYPASQYMAPSLRPYAFAEFDTFMQRTKKTYQDSRASANLDKLNSELKDVTKVMTKNIEDLLYRGDSLERMGDMSSRLREDSRKYRKAAVRINWELLLRQVSRCHVVVQNWIADMSNTVRASWRRWAVYHLIPLLAVLLVRQGVAIYDLRRLHTTNASKMARISDPSNVTFILE